MTSLLYIALVIGLSNGQTYLPPPPGHVFTIPANHQPPDTYSPTNQNTETQESSYQQQEAQIDDPYATMEIYKQRTPKNHKSVHVPVQVIKRPEVMVQSAESQLQVSPTEELKTLDYFTLLGGSPPAAAEDSNDYSTIFPKNQHIVQAEDNSGHASGYTPTKDEFSNGYFPSSPFQNSFGGNFEGEYEPSAKNIEGKPSRHYPVQLNNYSPLNSFNSPAGFTDDSSLKNLESAVDEAVLQKSLKPKKYSSKLKKFPKKYKSGSYKKLNKAKFNPNSELLDDFSLESMKNKRRILPRYRGSASPLSNSYTSGELNSFDDKGSHSDFTSGPELSSGYTGSSGSAGFSTGNAGLAAGSSGFTAGSSGFSAPSIGSGGDRMQFQMFGMDGPHSYKFGYDTGKGHNRHFRFEERDNAGKVKGHYGFYDQEGKMSMIHYEADPHTGYKAGPYHHPENHHDYDYNHQNSDYNKK